jgi:hypothetical protein
VPPSHAGKPTVRVSSAQPKAGRTGDYAVGVTDPGGANLQQLLDLLSAGDQPMVLPPWLPPVLATLIDGAGAGAEPAWFRRIGDRLRHSGGAVPFAVVHDWQARTVLPLVLTALKASEASEGTDPAEASEGTDPAEASERSDSAEAVALLQRLHARAATGEPAEAPVWLAALQPVLHALYRLAYDHTGSYASAHASATAYATANNFSADGALSFAESYAAHSAEANRQSFAESNAPANAAALAAAYAQHGGAAAEAAYAEAYPFALVRACAQAAATAPPAPGPDHLGQRRQAAFCQLAEGLADSITRVG